MDVDEAVALIKAARPDLKAVVKVPEVSVSFHHDCSDLVAYLHVHHSRSGLYGHLFQCQLRTVSLFSFTLISSVGSCTARVIH